MDAENHDNLLKCLSALDIANIEPANISWYVDQLKKQTDDKRQVCAELGNFEDDLFVTSGIVIKPNPAHCAASCCFSISLWHQ